VSKPKLYAVHPGGVISASDGQYHHLSAARLAELYGLSLASWIEWDVERPETHAGRRWDDYRHVWPRLDGKYTRPQEPAP